MRTAVICCLVALVGITTSKLTCPDWGVWLDDVCYKVIPASGLTSDTAEAVCSGDHAGGRLATIHNAGENTLLTNLMKKVLNTDTGNDMVGFLFGLLLSQQSDGSHAMTWNDNSPYDFSNWKSGQPDSGAEGGRVNLLSDGFWDDLDIGRPDDFGLAQGVLCQIDAETPRSVEGGAVANVQFINNSPVNVNVCWIDYEGNLVSTHLLSPEERVIQETNIGHNCVFRDAASDEMMVGNGHELYYPPSWATGQVHDVNINTIANACKGWGEWFDDICHKAIPATVSSYDNARSVCSDDHMFAQLVSIHNAAANTFLKNLMNKELNAGGNIWAGYIIGLRISAQLPDGPRSMLWDDYSTFDFFNWTPGNPNSGAEGGWGNLLADGLWDDIDIGLPEYYGSSQGVICQLDAWWLYE